MTLKEYIEIHFSVRTNCIPALRFTKADQKRTIQILGGDLKEEQPLETWEKRRIGHLQYVLSGQI